jgi:dTMP kinase
MPGPERGRFIVFEGGEACGKSTQAARLAERIGARLTREPGGTPLGERIRELLLDPASGEVDPRAEALLMAASRAHHVATLVEPTLASGQHVVSDRYLGSSVAYQGYGREQDPDRIAELSMWATRDLVPDLVLLLDVPAAVAAERRARIPDRLEAAGSAFHERVAEGFRALAAADPDVWVMIDGAMAIDAVAGAVDTAAADRLGLKVPSS